MLVISTIPKNKARAFTFSFNKKLSGNYSCSPIDKLEKLKGWSQFYCHTDFTAKAYSKIDRAVFWKVAYWFVVKFKTSIKKLMMKLIRRPEQQREKWSIIVSTSKALTMAYESCSRPPGV
ncbi:hypothetical protein BA953_24765 (plasmid) [Vibrio coralliilyticus]|nr:hypothetical protein BA953_24765 [Vibrio coralliilyticus]